MSEELTNTKQPMSINPFSRERDESIIAGAVSIEESRAIAEAQGALVIAKKFPRDKERAWNAIRGACSRKELAEDALYSYPRAGQAVTGPSITLAEVLAAAWGNIQYGTRELSRKEDVSEMEAYCWDTETNTRTSQQFTIKHIIDTKKGGRPVRDQRDIYELTANMSARRLRARILAIIPPDIIEAALAQVKATLQGRADIPLQDRIRSIGSAFAKLGINMDLLERRLNHKLADTLPEEVDELRSIYNSIKDGASSASDWFSVKTSITPSPVAPSGPSDDLTPPATAQDPESDGL